MTGEEVRFWHAELERQYKGEKQKAFSAETAAALEEVCTQQKDAYREYDNLPPEQKEARRGEQRKHQLQLEKKKKQLWGLSESGHA